MRSIRIPLIWSGPGPDGLREALSDWHGTPYLPDCQTPGVGVDCVRFVCGVMDSLTGCVTPPGTLPQDAALHVPEKARACMKQVLQAYQPFSRVKSRNVQGGDIVAVGPKSAGPSHAMLVGWEPNTLWHATHPRVMVSGFTLPQDFQVYKVFRHGW